MDGFFAYIGSCVSMAGGFYGLFAAADTVLRPGPRNTLARFLRGDSERGTVSEWADSFLGMFDGIFSNRRLSLRFFAMSALCSMCSVAVLALVWYVGNMSSGDIAKTPPEYVYWGLIATLALAPLYNVMPDYISLVATRHVISIMRISKYPCAWLLVYLIATFIIAALSFFLWATPLIYAINANTSSGHDGANALPGAIEAFLFKALPFDSLAAALFYSTFFTSLWLWLYFCAIVVGRALRRSQMGLATMNRILDIDSKPLRSIGFIAMCIVVIAYILAAPSVFMAG